MSYDAYDIKIWDKLIWPILECIYWHPETTAGTTGGSRWNWTSSCSVETKTEERSCWDCLLIDVYQYFDICLCFSAKATQEVKRCSTVPLMSLPGQSLRKPSGQCLECPRGILATEEASNSSRGWPSKLSKEGEVCRGRGTQIWNKPKNPWCPLLAGIFSSKIQQPCSSQYS